jgi:GNAT superfamily N-acetyltransferase
MEIKSMSEEDLEDVTKLSFQLGYPNSLLDVEQRFDEMKNDPRYALFVAKSDKVLGFIQVNAEPGTLLVGVRADVAALVVDEDFRGQGIGSLLVKRAEEWARENQFPLLRVRTNVKRTDTHRFYEREGFELTKNAYMFVKKL